MNALWFTLCLAVQSPVSSDSHAQRSRTPYKPVEGAFFALSVADMAASILRYTEKLGLDVVLEVPKQSGTAVTVLDGGGLIVELIQHDRARPLREAAPGVTHPQFIHGIYKVGFVVKDFDDVVAEFRARGVVIAFGPFPATESK